MQKEANASSLLFNKLTLLLIVLAAILLVIEQVFLKNLHYKGGIVGDAFYPVKFWLWIALWVVAWCVLGVISLVNVIVAVVKLYKKRETRRGRVLVSFLPLLLLCIPFYSSQQTEAGAVYFLRGYEKWVEREVDIPAIQGWLASVPSDYSGKRYFDAEKFPDDLPEAVTKLKPQYIYFSTFENAQRRVEFEWGCAFGHWGIRIGLPGMDTPQGEECIIISEGEWEYRRPVQSGVYIFDRG